MPQTKPEWDVADISDHGERVTHLFANDCYYAHLALYDFALQFCQGGDVLDAGSGTGYGAAFLAQRGARSVVGIDISPKAVAFSRANFQLPNLLFDTMSLEQIANTELGSFDFIYCSNVLEHIYDLRAFLNDAVKLLRPTGQALFAVPPITSPQLRAADLTNPYHLNSWSPKQWHSVLGQYFGQLQPYGHYFERVDYPLNFSNFPHETRINEKDFVFRAIPVEGFAPGNSLTAVFVVSQPKPAELLPPANQPIDLLDDSVSRPPPPNPRGTPRLVSAWRNGQQIWRQHGAKVFMREIAGFLRREWAVWQARQK